MGERTLERQQSIEQAEEQKTLREIQLVREQQEKEQVQDRVLYFEDSGGFKIVSYNDYEKATASRDPEGNEKIEIEEITIDEKNELDTMYELVEENDYEQVNMDDVDFPDTDIEEEMELDDDFSRDESGEIDQDDDMEYE